MKYKTFGPDAEVFGGAMLAFVKSINCNNFSQILADHDLEEIDPNQWYPQQVWLDVFTDIASGDSASSNLVSIGMKIAEVAVVPPEAEALSFQQIMMAFNEASYLANNRGNDVGGIEANIVDDNHLIMIDKTPYPDDFIYGAYYAMARRFLPKGTQFLVEFDEDQQRREQGGDATQVHIRWE